MNEFFLEFQVNISKKNVINESNVFSHWFEYDIQAMLDEKFEWISDSESDNIFDNSSWYVIFYDMIISLTYQFILLNLDYQNIDKKTNKYDLKINENIDNFDKINITKFLIWISIKWNQVSLFSIYNFNLEE